MIQDAKIGRVAVQPLLIKLLLFGAIFISLLGIGVYVNNAVKALQFSSLPKERMISHRTLEEKYGLRVNLVAVTAAGGMVDLRLKIINAQKAKLLLRDKKNFPALMVGRSNTTLNASEETKSQNIQFEDNGNLFLLFPNTGNVIKRGDSVAVVFGNIALEPLAAR